MYLCKDFIDFGDSEDVEDDAEADLECEHALVFVAEAGNEKLNGNGG